MTIFPEDVHLTPREIEVLYLVVAGFSSKMIAMKLDIAPRTVEGHIERIRLRMGAANRCHMVGLAASMGLLEQDDQTLQLNS